MVRASVARVLARLGGAVYPTGWNATNVGDLCTAADYIIDSYTSPRIMSTTADTAIEIAVEVVMRMMTQADVMRRSSGASASEGTVFPDIRIITDDLKQRIDAVLNTSYSIAIAIDMVAD